ncbi:hypothetical protein FQN50_001540 [Emmonsiellopsis sp. PD_5]|nr:hypothetical protein FQN50_001540 [Emmonsiellopsis sp. PD_5]
MAGVKVVENKMEKATDPLDTNVSTDPEKGFNPNISKSNNNGMASISSSHEGDGEIEIDQEPRNLSLSRTATNSAGREGVLSKTLSLVRTKESIDVGPPPDGGLEAWTVVLLGHFSIANTWGYINAFGCFQSHYTESLGRSHRDVAWIGSIQIFLLFFIGTFSGRATDAGFFKPLLISGGIILLIGIFMTSLATEYWQLFLSQGVCMGIGCGLMFCPTMAVISTYFSAKKALAIALVASGSSTGGLIFPAIVQTLLPRIGYPWTMRVLGFFSLATLIPCFIFLRQRIPPRKSGPLFDWAAFKDPRYSLFGVAMFLNFWGLYVAFFYISSYGRDIIGVSREKSIELLLILNGVGFLGRVIPNWISDVHSGPLNALIPSTAVASILLFGWIGIKEVNELYAFACLYGFFAGGLQSLFPATVATLTPDLKKTGIRFGMILSIVSFASLTGSPIAGALIQLRGGGYLYAQLFGGLSMLVGTAVLVGVRFAVTGPAWKVRV